LAGKTGRSELLARPCSRKNALDLIRRAYSACAGKARFTGRVRRMDALV
jgi:hypothetical protein